MENDIIQIEYKKFSSFLKDFIKNFSRGHVFLVSDEERATGETFSFSIEVEGLEKPLKAIRKANSLPQYEEAVNRLFDEHALQASPCFSSDL